MVSVVIGNIHLSIVLSSETASPLCMHYIYFVGGM